jgi:hypothetical protein
MAELVDLAICNLSKLSILFFEIAVFLSEVVDNEFVLEDCLLESALTFVDLAYLAQQEVVLLLEVSVLVLEDLQEVVGYVGVDACVVLRVRSSVQVGPRFCQLRGSRVVLDAAPPLQLVVQRDL